MLALSNPSFVALAVPISSATRFFVAGLIPEATSNKRGFANAALNYQFLDATLNRTLLIGKLNDESAAYTFKLIQAQNAPGIKNSFSVFIVGITLMDRLYSSVISINGNPFDAHFFIKDGCLYYKVNLIGGYLFVYGSNVKIIETQLPEDAEEVEITPVG